MNQTLVFPACVKQLDEVYKVYIPDVDMEFRATSFADALTKTRRMLRFSLLTGEITSDDVAGDLCADERVKRLLWKNHKEDYLDARITYIDLVWNFAAGPGQGELSVKLPHALIDGLEENGIDANGIVQHALEDALRRKNLLNNANKLLEHTVKVQTWQYAYYGLLKRVTPPDSLGFVITLQTGLHSVTRIPATDIEEISETPVVMNDIGTFHVTNQEGIVSIAGSMWWYKDHIDVYLEYDPLFEIEDQKGLEYLERFNEVKYDMDAEMKERIADYFKESYAFPQFFPLESEEDPAAHMEADMEQLTEKLELWFVNITLGGELYMDYNFKNEYGSFTVGVETDLQNRLPKLKLSDFVLYDEEYEDVEEDDL